MLICESAYPWVMTLTKNPTPEQKLIDVDELFSTITGERAFSAKEADRFISQVVNSTPAQWETISQQTPLAPVTYTIGRVADLTRRAVNWSFDVGGPMEHNAIMGNTTQKGDLTIWSTSGQQSHPPIWITAPIMLIRHDNGSTRVVSQPKPGTLVTGSTTEFQVTTYTGLLISHLAASVLAHLCRSDFVTTMTTREEAWKYTGDLAFMSIIHRCRAFGLINLEASQVITLTGFLHQITMRPEIAPVVLETLPIGLAGACPGNRISEAENRFHRWAAIGVPDTYAVDVIAPFVEPGTTAPQFVAQVRMAIDSVSELVERRTPDDEIPTWGDISLPWHGEHIRRIQLPQIHDEVSAALELMIQRINQANPGLAVGCGQEPTESLTWSEAQDLAIRVLADAYREDGIIRFTPSSEIIQGYLGTIRTVLTTWPHNLTDTEVQNLTSVRVANLTPEVPA